MATVALVWELGGERGHITRLCALARVLLRQQHRIFLIVSDHSLALELMTEEERSKITVVTLPKKNQQAVTLSREPCSFSEVLLSSGYHSVQYLLQQFSVWVKLFDRIKPNCVVFDYAPTAVIAATNFNFKKIVIGDGFAVPPEVSPWPCFMPGDTLKRNNLVNSDRVLLQAVNSALSELGLLRLSSIQSVFSEPQRLLLTVPPLDPYRDYRNTEVYCGTIEAPTDFGCPIGWGSDLNYKRIVGYLKPDYPLLAVFLKALRSLDVYANLYIPGVSEAFVTNFGSNELKILSGPLRMGGALDKADFFVGHGGHSFTLQCLQKNIPGLVIPLQKEQSITALKLTESGWGNMFNPFDSGIELKLKTFLVDRNYKNRLSDANHSSMIVGAEKICALINP